MSVIYRITCQANGRAYIGSTVRSPNQRWLEHLHYLRNGTHHSRHMQKVFAKYGEDSFTFEVIELVEDRLFLLAREQFQVWRHEGRLMNGKDAVAPGVHFTEEVRAKMSVSRRARVMPPVSDETKAKIAASNTGKKRTPEQVANIMTARLAWIERERAIWVEMVKNGMSYRAIEKETGRSRSVIIRECRGHV